MPSSAEPVCLTIAELIAALRSLPATAPICATWEGIYVGIIGSGIHLSTDGIVVLNADTTNFRSPWEPEAVGIALLSYEEKVAFYQKEKEEG